MNTHKHDPNRRFLVMAVCLGLGITGTFTNTSYGQNLLAHWSLDQISSISWPDSSTNNCTLYQDPNTTTAEIVPGIAGNALFLNWQNPPGTSTHLYATNSALQSDSFGFSFWINPQYLNDFDNLMVKEIQTNSATETLPGYAQLAWQVHMLGNNGSGAAPIEFVVRGDPAYNEGGGDFYGVVQSSTNLPLYTNSVNIGWINIAGGYDANLGNLYLYVNGVQSVDYGTPGATNSDGAPLDIGTGEFGPGNYNTFSATTYIDDVQIYDSPLSQTNVDFLMAHPGLTLGQTIPPNIHNFLFDPVSGNATITFDSASGQSCSVDASTNLATGFITVTNLTASGSSTTVVIPKAILDQTFGATPNRQQVFYRVSTH